MSDCCNACKEYQFKKLGRLCPDCKAERERDACEHADLDDGICLDCGLDRRGEILADRIDAAKDRRKYGD